MSEALASQKTLRSSFAENTYVIQLKKILGFISTLLSQTFILFLELLKVTDFDLCRILNKKGFPIKLFAASFPRSYAWSQLTNKPAIKPFVMHTKSEIYFYNVLYVIDALFLIGRAKILC